VNECFGCNDLDTVLRLDAPDWVLRDDKELMLRAVELDCHSMYEIPLPLCMDRDLHEMAVRHVEFLGFLSDEAQLRYPDLVIKSIRKNCKGGGEGVEYLQYLSDELWENLDVCRA